MTNLKQKIIIIIAIIGALLIAIFGKGFYSKISQPIVKFSSSENQKSPTDDNQIKLLSTNPNPLDGAILLPVQTIELTFNQPIENRGEFKHQIDPKPDLYEVKLSSDRKTVKIIPQKPFRLGTPYTLFVKTETKFDNKQRLPNELIFHFSTIEYKLCQIATLPF